MSILEFPELWAFLAFYIFSFHLSFISTRFAANYEPWIPIYIRGYEVYFFTEAAAYWNVRQLRPYFREWSKREGWVLLFTHVLLTLAANALDNKYPYCLMPFTLGNLWKMHIQILDAQNHRLLRGIL